MLELFEKLKTESKNKKEIIAKISSEFGISDKDVHKRIRSLYGKTIDEILTPSREDMFRAILKSDSIEDLKRLLGVSNGLGRLYELYFNTSTFASAKKVCESYREVSPYCPSKADNISILISQKLGDGYFEVSRKYISIHHSEKQADYLVEKVKLLNKAYPRTNPVGSIIKDTHIGRNLGEGVRGKPFTYYRYRSGIISSSDYDYVVNTPNHLLVGEITPLGMFLLYMDDGCLTVTTNVTQITMCNSDYKVRCAIQKYLDSYGIKSSVYVNVVAITSTTNVIKFLNNFVKPFSKYMPDCMAYKVNLMI